MDRMPQRSGSLILDPLPFVRGLYQLIPERRLAAILTWTARSSEQRQCLPAGLFHSQNGNDRTFSDSWGWQT